MIKVYNIAGSTLQIRKNLKNQSVVTVTTAGKTTEFSMSPEEAAALVAGTETISFTRVPLREVKEEFNSWGHNPSRSDMIDFVSTFEVEISRLNNKMEREVALWWAVREMSKMLDRRMSFSSAMSKMRWPSTIRHSTSVPMSVVMKDYRNRSDDVQESTEEKIRIAIEEMMDDFTDNQEDKISEFHRSWNPFHRRKLARKMMTLNEFLDKVARKELQKRFSDRAAIDKWIKKFSNVQYDLPDDIEQLQATTAARAFSKKSYERWAFSVLSEIMDSEQSEDWHRFVVDTLSNYMPNRKDTDAQAFARAHEAWDQFSCHTHPVIVDLADEMHYHLSLKKGGK